MAPHPARKALPCLTVSARAPNLHVCSWANSPNPCLACPAHVNRAAALCSTSCTLQQSKAPLLACPSHSSAAYRWCTWGSQ